MLLEQQLKIEQIGPHGDGLADSLPHGDAQFGSARRAKSVPAHGDRLMEPTVSRWSDLALQYRMWNMGYINLMF